MKQPLLGKHNAGLLFILSAPSGTGKTTLVQMLTKEFDRVVLSVTYTTREKREGEIDGVHYSFITKEQFIARIDEGDFLEYVEIYGDYYGTSKSWVEEQRQKGKHVFLVIDTQGTALLKGRVDAVTIFVLPPSLEELKRRLTLRRSDSMEMIEKRLKWAKREIKAIGNYQYCIVNDDLQTAYQILRSIVIAEEHRFNIECVHSQGDKSWILKIT